VPRGAITVAAPFVRILPGNEQKGSAAINAPSEGGVVTAPNQNEGTVPESVLRTDVLVHVEQVVRVVVPFDLDESVVGNAVVGGNTVLIVCGHEVDVPPFL
jgi:hypothetical protein